MKERKMKLTWEYYHTMIFWDFKVVLNQEECFQYLQLTYVNTASSHATVFRWFTECHRGQNSLLDEEQKRRPLLAIALGKQKMLINNNCCPYQMI